MTNKEVITMSSEKEGNIDRGRIVDGHLVSHEYFCPICQCLLWKPRSCSSCQHLFCEKCIQMWIENTNKCPFRCQSYEERRCPPYIQSLLSRLNIHCRNSLFGCTQIVSYDLLEHHENVECKYLSKICSVCEQLVLVSKFDEHQEVPGLCIPCPIKCVICQNLIEKSLFRKHWHRCCEERANQLLHKSLTTTIQLFEQQKQLSRLPTNLKGVDTVRRAREENCGHLLHILIMLKFLLLNWIKIPFFLFVFTTSGMFGIGTFILAVYIFFFHWTYTHKYGGPVLLVLLPYLSSYGTSIIFEFVCDKTIIFFLGIFTFLWGCSNRVSLEVLETDSLFNRPIFSIILYCVGILIMKIILLLIRFYYWSMPTYIAAGFFTFINFYVYNKVKTHCVFACTLARRRNQQTMPV